MRLGGPLFQDYETPGQWVDAVRANGYRAALCPVEVGATREVVDAYAVAAREADIVIAEVGTWSNPLSTDPTTRDAALDLCKQGLALADAIGAVCCVNIAGSRGAKWDGPCTDDLTDETFDLVVQTVREIIDAVAPSRSAYTLEPMPWMYPDSPDSYLALLRAIDRPAFAVHFDPANLVNSPRRYFRNADLIREFVAKLGPHIKSCHAKDILLRDQLTVHLDEVCPGCGNLDFRVLLSELAALPGDMPILVEHLPDAEAHAKAADHLRRVAKEEGIRL